MIKLHLFGSSVRIHRKHTFADFLYSSVWNGNVDERQIVIERKQGPGLVSLAADQQLTHGIERSVEDLVHSAHGDSLLLFYQLE
jgi:hypothetical protein